MAFACISGHMAQDTVAVHVFVEKLINDYVNKLYPPNFRKFTTSVTDHVPNTLQVWRSWRDC